MVWWQQEKEGENDQMIGRWQEEEEELKSTCSAQLPENGANPWHKVTFATFSYFQSQSPHIKKLSIKFAWSVLTRLSANIPQHEKDPVLVKYN